MLRSFCNGIVFTILLSRSLVSHDFLCAAGLADERVDTTDDQSAPALKIDISEFEASLVTRDAQEFTLQLIMAVKVENIGDDTITIAREQFELLIKDAPAEIGSVDSHPNFSRTILEPGKSAEGWIGFASIKYDGAEQPMVLRWKPPATEVEAKKLKPVDTNLNEELRRQSDFQVARIGPEGCLLQVTTNRNLDVLAIWPVATILKTAAAEKVSRILFSSMREKQPVMHEEFNLWLTTMIDTSATANDPNLRFAPRMTPPFPRQEIQFHQIVVGGLTEVVNRQYGLYRRPVSVLTTAEAAISLALTPVYRRVATEVAVADLQNQNPGIRRAAMAGAVDRLTPAQSEIIINEALRGTPELQIEVAGYLNQVSGSKSVEALRILSDSTDSRVSMVALRSLIRSLDPAAEAEMTELWLASRSNPEKQNQILNAIIQLKSERWTSLVAGYVADRIHKSSLGATASVTRDDTPESVAEPDDNDPPDSFSSENRIALNQRSLLGEALTFLRAQKHAGTLEVLRSHLLQLTDPALQDIALSALVEAREGADDAVIRKCLEQRIRSNNITDSVRNAIVQLPSSAWTEALLLDLKADKNHENPPLAAQAMLRCASASQLDGIVNDFASLHATAQQQTLRHLAMLDHPRWKPLAKTLIDKPLRDNGELNSAERSIARSIASEILQLLAIDASEESIEMLTSRLAKAVTEIGTSDDIPIESRMFAHSLIEKIAMFVHPECRRSLNRTARCDNKDLQADALRQIQAAQRRSPAIQMLVMRLQNLPNDERRLEDNEETIAFYGECIEQDPYLTEIYVRRSSVLMHLSRFDETMTDLKTASQLSPENMDVESMIALCQIRLGETEAGLKYAEELVVMAPRDLSSLYNGACSYSRALENPDVSEDQKKRYGDRAIELIRQTIATEFGDFEHLQSDEDLVAMHTHPEWQAVVDETKKMNEENKKKLLQ